jgi:excisionase family DNA binding protein
MTVFYSYCHCCIFFDAEAGVVKMGASSDNGFRIEPMINANQAAKILGLHPVTVRTMAARKEIPAIKIGKLWRFRASSLDEWIESALQEGVSK